MATKIILAMIGAVMFSAVSAQTYFYNTYGGYGYDTGQDIIQLESDSSFIIVGSSSSSGPAPNQVLLMQVDQFGNFMTARFFGGMRSDIGVRIMHKENEGYWIAGYSNSFTDDANFDFYLIKLNENFEFQWQQTYGTGNWERLHDAILLPDDGVLLVGEVEGIGHTGKDGYMVRTDANGEVLWQETFSGPDDNVVNACVLFDANSILIAGKRGNTVSNAWMSRINLDGSVIWNMTNYLDNQGTGEILGITLTDDRIYIHGHYTPAPFQEDNYRPFRIMCQLDGTVFLPTHYYFENSMLESMVGICAVQTNNVIGVVETRDPNFVGNNGPRAFLYGYNINLDYTGFNHTVFGARVNAKRIIRSLDTEGAFVIVGFTEDLGMGFGGSSVFILRLNNSISALENFTYTPILELENFTDIGFQFYPNPTQASVNIQLPESIQATIFYVYDISGKKVMSGTFQNELDFSSLDAGQYQLLLETNQGMKSMRFQKF
jgi:hypothetical protein